MSTWTQVTDYALWPERPVSKESMLGMIHWEIHVIWRGTALGMDRWVIRHLGYVLRHDGEWVPESGPNWGEEFLAQTALPYDQAMNKAREVVHSLKVNGRAWADWKAYLDEEGVRSRST